MAPTKTLKRERDENGAGSRSASPAITKRTEEHTAGATENSTSNFRNVSACNRCRTRKNRCDQKLPSCTGCEKARIKCVGFDPVSKRTIPRSYVYYLETRVSKLEELLQAHNIAFEPPEDDFSISKTIRPGINVPFPVEEESGRTDTPLLSQPTPSNDPTFSIKEMNQRPARHGDLTPVQDATKQAEEASKPNISFARVVVAAVRSTVADTSSERANAKTSKRADGRNVNGGSPTRDSFFGLCARPAVEPASFPDRDAGKKLVDLYFDYANPQIPTLHREDFMSIFERVYEKNAKMRTPREWYMLNIVFAIGSGIIMDSSRAHMTGSPDVEPDHPLQKRMKQAADQQHQPEEYHAAAVIHLDRFLGSPPLAGKNGSGLEELQAVCLLAGLALLRPVAPGLWYIIGVAVRLAVDLGLHSEDTNSEFEEPRDQSNNSDDKGRKQWYRDLRRRLWWCVYSLDRLVSTCVGRPFGITDQVVTTEFPSVLDDQYITTNGFSEDPDHADSPTYKLIAQHYFRLRLLQSEILQVLQHRQAERARALGTNCRNAFIHKHLISPFMGKFSSFQDWRMDVDQRLWEWKESAPRKEEIGVAFTPLFLELNYWQAVILLYRQSLAVPELLASFTDTAGVQTVQSPGTVNERREDEEMVLMKVAQAGQTVLKLYRQLHRLQLVNYTYLATHHLFMCGISFLHAIWHSQLVRSQLTLDDVDFTVFIATSVLEDLIAKCPPAEACRDAFVRMAKATIAMVEKSTGFGRASTLASQPLNDPNHVNSRDEQQKTAVTSTQPQELKSGGALPQFDMDLKALFSEDEIASRPLAQQFKLHTTAKRSRQMQIGAAPQVSSTPAGQQGAGRNVEDYTQTTSMLHQSPTTVCAASATTQQPLYDQQYPRTSHSTTLSSQTPFQPLVQPLAGPQQDYALDADLSFLDTFPFSDTSSGQNDWSNGWNDFDMGFATGGAGGTAWDSGADWTGLSGGGVDMFDGFFFGGDGGNGGFG